MLGVSLQKRSERLQKKLPKLTVDTAIQKAQEFVGGATRLYNRRRDYLRATRMYVETARALGLSLSLEPEQGRGYSLTRQEKDLLRRSAPDVVTDLITRPDSPYQNGWVPVSEAGEELARKVFGDNYRDGSRNKVVAMMLSNRPGKYGLDKKQEDGNTYVKTQG